MRARTILLPVIAVVLVALVLGVQLASGGNDYRPSAPPSTACVRQPPAIPKERSLDALTQVLVIDAVQRASCRLGTSRERLLLALPSAKERGTLAKELRTTDAAILSALRSGLLESLDRLERERALPPVSSLLDDLVDRLGLPGIAVLAIRQIPTSVVDELLPTAAVLRRAITSVDLAKVLGGISDTTSLEDALVPAIRDAAAAEARDRLSERLQQAGGLFGLGG